MLGPRLSYQEFTFHGIHFHPGDICIIAFEFWIVPGITAGLRIVAHVSSHTVAHALQAVLPYTVWAFAQPLGAQYKIFRIAETIPANAQLPCKLYFITQGSPIHRMHGPAGIFQIAGIATSITRLLPLTDCLIVLNWPCRLPIQDHCET